MPEVLQQFSEGIRRKNTDKCAVETGCGEKAYRGRIWRMMGREPCVRGIWEYFLFREQAEEEKQAEYKVSGSWNRQPENTWSK